MKILKLFLKHPNLLDGAAVWECGAENPTGTRRYERGGPLLKEVGRLVREAHVFVIEDDPILPAIVQGHERGTLIVEQRDQIAGRVADSVRQSITAPREGSGRAELPEGWESRPMLAPPFPICWFEVCTSDGASIPMRFYRDDTLSQIASDDRIMSGAIGALLHEITPGVYDLFVMEISGKQTQSSRTSIPGERSYLADCSMAVSVYRGIDSYESVSSQLPTTPPVQVANHWLSMVNDGIMAIEEVSADDGYVPIPREDRPHKKAAPHQIRRIVRILPKRTRPASVKPITAHGVIDWSHRWEVRGHWRKVHGIGKDRAGDYVVEGWTWVNDFVKGPDDKPLVKKTRVLNAKEAA